MVSSQNVVLSNIQAELASRSVPQKSLAGALGITQQALSMKLKGTRPLRLEELHKVAEFLDVDVQALYAKRAS